MYSMEWNKNVSQVEIIVFTDEPTFKDTYTNLEVEYVQAKSKLLWDYVNFPLKARNYDLIQLFIQKILFL